MTKAERIAKPIVGMSRIAVGVLAICVILYAYFEGFAEGRTNPFNYFGYFTNLTSTATGIILISAGIMTLARHQSELLTVLRAIAVTCMIVVAVIYNGIVPGTGTAAPWVSVSLHIVLPALVILDWVFVSDRQPLPWSKLWLVLPFPIVWLAVVLVRGLTDGWVPYGFLLPQQGATAMIATVTALFAALLCAGALTWLLSRVMPARALVTSLSGQ